MTTELLAWLINATLAISPAGIAVLLLRKSLQRQLGAEIAYRLWIVMPLAALAACFSLPHVAPTASAAAPSVFAAAPTIVVRANLAMRGLDADRWLLAIWLCGACALVVVLVRQQWHYVARLRLRKDDDGNWRSGTSDAAPAVLGVLRQKLVLPERFEADYSDDERQLVIAHERMHQQRRDPWALAICAALRALFWFNPIVHVAAVRFRRDVEIACDAAVLRLHPGSRQRYANALLKTHIAEHALPVGCLWENTPPMKERIMLLKQGLPARRTRTAGAIMVAIAAFGVSGFAAAGHESAMSTASALAVASAPATNPISYKVQLAMSVNGKPAGSPSVVTRSGETAMVKLDDNGVAWGFRFHIEPESGSKNAAIRINGDVFANGEQHVIGNANLAVTPGTPAVIALNDKSGAGTGYRIVATITQAHAPTLADETIESGSAAPEVATTGPREKRDIRIVRKGVPAPGDAVDDEDMRDEAMPADAAAPGDRREIRREVTMGAASDDVGRDGKRHVERRVVIVRRDGMAPPPPLPSIPAPDAMRAPPAPPAPPVLADMPAPPAPPPLPPPGAHRGRPMSAPLPPPPPPAPPVPMLAPAPPAPPTPPTPDSQGQTAPAYPAAALAGKIGGGVKLKVLVGVDGSVQHAEVVTSHPAGVFDKASLEAARKWHYSPARNAQGQAVEAYVMVPVNFEPRRR